jgi:hypothetical protein
MGVPPQQGSALVHGPSVVQVLQGRRSPEKSHGAPWLNEVPPMEVLQYEYMLLQFVTKRSPVIPLATSKALTEVTCA